VPDQRKWSLGSLRSGPPHSGLKEFKGVYGFEGVYQFEKVKGFKNLSWKFKDGFG